MTKAAARATLPKAQRTPESASPMPVSVRIPTPLRNLADGADLANAQGDTLADAIADLERQFPGIKDRLLDEDGEIRRFVNIFVNGEDVRFEQGLATALKDGSEVSIVPAVAGG